MGIEIVRILIEIGAKINSLDRHNYSYWRSLIIPLVRAHGLEGILRGTTPRPEPLLAGTNTMNPGFNHWIRCDALLMSWLMNSLSEAMLGHVLHCESAADIWTVFASLFATQSKARQLQLHLSIQNTKKGSLSIDEYILKMKNLVDSLAGVGHKLLDQEFVMYILGGVGHEYETVVILLTARADALTLQEVQYMLQNQEMRIEQTNSQNLDNVQANYAQFNKNASSSNGNNNCGRDNHRAVVTCEIEALNRMVVVHLMAMDVVLVLFSKFVARLVILHTNVIIDMTLTHKPAPPPLSLKATIHKH
uniref:Retrotransposon Copia-like N-terminal domain-containing protein n=1 Tax=Cannabis sativa TaxID=3483 RepID=A0A803P2J3_CANSA